MSDANPADPLHGVTLKALLIDVVGHFGWKRLAQLIPLRCFMFEPTLTSSLKYLRKNPADRARVEKLYVDWKTGHGPVRNSPPQGSR